SRIDRRTFVSVGAVGLAGSILGLRAAVALDKSTPEASPFATPGATPAGPKTELTVKMGEFYYDPNEFTIPANTDVTIHLKNAGDIAHTFNIDHNHNDTDPKVHSGNVLAGGEHDITINLDAGDWYFYC